MHHSFHYLLMADHLQFQKAYFAAIKETGLTPGQPKILDYLQHHDGAVQKQIAEACHIEPATITSVLLGMEKKGLITRKNRDGDRRSLYVYLTEKGHAITREIAAQFDAVEKTALAGLDDPEKAQLIALLEKVNQNLKTNGGENHA